MLQYSYCNPWCRTHVQGATHASWPRHVAEQARTCTGTWRSLLAVCTHTAATWRRSASFIHISTLRTVVVRPQGVVGLMGVWVSSSTQCVSFLGVVILGPRVKGVTPGVFTHLRDQREQGRGGCGCWVPGVGQQSGARRDVGVGYRWSW